MKKAFFVRMAETAHILIVDDDAGIRSSTELVLRQAGYQVSQADQPTIFQQKELLQTVDLVLLDLNFSRAARSGKEGLYWLRQLQNSAPELAVVLITAYGGVEMAIRAIKQGATDFLEKPWTREQLLRCIKTALQMDATRHAAQPGAFKAQEPNMVVGQSEAIRKVFDTVAKVAETDANVLLLGENGTGKALVAQSLHTQSHRREGPFVQVDVGALRDTLFESELFGHRKGAFTDARQDREGRFVAAREGTLFLDEIGNIPLELQVKLLSALEQRRVTPLGSNNPIEVDIRLICATNISLQEAVRNRAFRQDLLYRINTVEIHIPPLRARQEDIPILADYFTAFFSQKYQKSERHLSPATHTFLQGYAWPGNVRELRHAIERAVIMADRAELRPQDFQLTDAPPALGEMQLQTLNLEEVESMVIRQAMRKYNGNISQAARALGLTRTSLYRRIEKYGL
ncbi:MAG: sigma-54 dependent transcriptional regulator [Bacteroidota bacterium]